MNYNRKCYIIIEIFLKGARMEFFTVSKLKRPVRLTEKTRQFAYESLNDHKYGLDTAENYGVDVDDVNGFDSLDDNDRYDLAIRRISENAPIRICEGELVSGAATLGAGIDHCVPALHDGKIFLYSVSHLTIDFETVLKRGVSSIAKAVSESRKIHTDAREIRFLDSCESVLESFGIYHRRYLNALKEKGMTDNYNALLNVPYNPASTFREAVQSIWFVFSFVRLCGNWPGFGRLDVLLGDYLKNDLEKGIITLDDARELLAHFFIKGCEWVKGGNYGSGDAQHYQNIVLSGIDENRRDVTNEVSYLVLDIIEELGISDFPTTIRLNKNTDEKLLERACEVVRYGGGVIAFYDEDSIIESLTDYGYPFEEAAKFANDGCWEIQVPGRTNFSYNPFDSLEILQTKTLNSFDNYRRYPDFESLYSQYLLDMADSVKDICSYRINLINADGRWKPNLPCTVVSLFEGGCIQKARSYLEGGTVYSVHSPHIGGLPDTVNALYAIKKAVYEDKLVSFDKLMEALRDNWEGHEDLRLKMLNSYSYFGNDNDECDEIAARLVDDFAKACKEYDGVCEFKFPAGISTFGRQLQWIPHRLASPHGHKKDEILAGNYSPTPGTDREGATAIIKSYCKSDLKKMVSGAALDLKLLPSNVEGEDGLRALVSLLRGFVVLGGSFIQPDVCDAEILREAQEHPENYQTLSVRVSGWNARFVTLDKDWQQMIIEQNEK